MARQPPRTIAEEIRRIFDRLTPTERKPAQALLVNYPLAGLDTVAKFASQSGVSGPTILRLVGKLGFSGYADFQRALREELEVRLQSPLAKTYGKEAAGKGNKDFLGRFAAAVRDNIEESLKSLPGSEFEAAIRLLADRKRTVHVLGGRFTGAIAAYLYAHLRVLRPNVHLVEGHSATWREDILDMGRRDVLAVFDIRRYQGEVVRFAEQAAGRGATVVLFTDQWLSPISRLAKHTFPVRIDVPSRWDSAVVILTLVEALIAGVSERHWHQVKDRVRTLEVLKGLKSPDV